MNEADDIGLELRFRGREVSHAPPDVDAFLRRPADAGPLHARPEEIAVLKGPPLAERTPLVVFFQHAGFGIPPVDAIDVTLELDSWSVRPTVFGYLACVSATSRSPGRARAAWVIAAWLPLVLPADVGAAPPADKGAVQRPKTSRPVTAPPVVESEPVGEPEVVPPETVTETDLFVEDTTAVAPVTVPPKPSASRTDAAVVDAAWEGVDGFEVDLRLKGGIRMRGRVGAVQADTFTLIQHGTGAVLVLPKSGVLSLRAHTPPPIPEKTGTGLMAGGIVLTSIASPIFISGVAMLAVCPSCTYIHLPLLIIGAGLLGGGIPMTVVGTRRRQKYRRILEEHAVAPVVVRTSHGWSGGLRFRF